MQISATELIQMKTQKWRHDMSLHEYAYIQQQKSQDNTM